MDKIKQKLLKLIILSQEYMQTDMKYAAKGGFWLNLGRLGLFFVSFVTLTAFSRFVSAETYGSYQYIISTIAIFSVFSLPGIETSLIKSMVQGKEGTFIAALKEKLKFSVGGCISLFAVAAWYFSRGNTPFAFSFLAAGFLFPFFESFKIFGAYWHSRKDFRKKSLYLFLTELFSAVLFIPIIFLTEDIFWIILVFLLSRTFFSGIFLIKTAKQTGKGETDYQAIRFGKHLSLINSIPFLTTHIDKIFLWHFLGPVQLAIYSFAYLPINRINALFPISQLALPKLSEIDIRKTKRQILKKMKILFLLIIPILIIIYLLAPFMYSMFFPSYLNSLVYFRFLIILLFLAPMQIIDASLITAHRKKDLYTANISTSIIKILLLLILIPVLGVWGAVTAFIFADVLNAFVKLYFFYRM